MAHKDLYIASAFARAVCAHFGLPSDQVESQMTLASGPKSSVTLAINIALTAQDLVDITAAAKREPEQDALERLNKFLGKPEIPMPRQGSKGC